jgi:hypothetical protein
MAWIFQRRVDMDDLTDDLRIRIHYKLESGQLPYDSATKVSGRPATGETCAACDSTIDEGLVMECLVGAGAQRGFDSTSSASSCGTTSGDSHTNRPHSTFTCLGLRA